MCFKDFERNIVPGALSCVRIQYSLLVLCIGAGKYFNV